MPPLGRCLPRDAEDGRRLGRGHALQPAQGDQGAVLGADRKAVELEPDLFQAFCNMGVALTAEGEHEEAASALRRAYRLAPNDEYLPHLAAAVLGWVRELRRDDQLDRAIEVLEHHVRAFPKIPSLAAALERLRDG